MQKATVSTVSFPSRPSLSRSRGGFFSQFQSLNEPQVSEFYAPERKTKPKFQIANSKTKSMGLKIPPRETDEANQSQWLPRCISAASSLQDHLKQDSIISLSPNDAGFYLDKLSSVSYQFTSIPQIVQAQLIMKRLHEPSYEPSKGYLQNLKSIYYIVDKQVFFFKIDRDLKLGEPTTLTLNDRAFFAVYGSIRSGAFTQLKNVMIITQPHKLSLFDVRSSLSKIEIVPLNIEIPVDDMNIKHIAITRLGDIFYLDSEGKLNQVMDQKRFFKADTIAMKRVEPSLIQRIKSRFPSNITSPFEWVSSTFSAIKSTFVTKIMFSPTPLQLLVDERSRHIFTLIRHDCKISSYYQISMYSYEGEMRLVRILKEDEIVREMAATHNHLGGASAILKLATVSLEYLREGNLEIQFESGVRVFVVMTEKRFKVVRVSYPPDFELVVKDPNLKLLEKEHICSVDYSQGDDMRVMQVINTVNKSDRYSCLYLNLITSQIQSYLEHRGYRSAPTVTKLPWVTLHQDTSSLSIHPIDLHSLKNSPTYNLLLKNKYTPSKNTYQLSQQVYNQPTAHLLLSTQNIQFSLTLRPIDRIFGILKHFSLAEIKVILSQLMLQQIPHHQLIIIFIAIICNQQLTCYVSTKINMHIENTLKKNKLPYDREDVDIVTTETSCADLQNKASMILEWVISSHIHAKNRKRNIYNVQTEEEKRPELEEEVLSHCTEMYTARVIEPLLLKTVDKIDEDQAFIVMKRLNEIHCFIANKARYYNLEAKKLKDFIIRSKQLLSVLPRIRFYMDNKLDFLNLVTNPSKFFQEYLFRGYMQKKFNHLTLWKEQRMLITKELMIMFKAIEQIETKEGLQEIQATLSSLHELPQFFKEYLRWRKIDIKMSLKNIEDYDSYFTKRISEASQCIKSIRDKKELDKIELKEAIEARKLMRMQYYLVQYFETHSHKADVLEILRMDKEALEEVFSTKCDILSNTIFRINYQILPKGQELKMTEYFQSHSTIPTDQMYQNVRTLFKFLQPTSSPIRCMVQSLISYFLPQSTFYFDAPKFFNIQKQLKTAHQISNLLFASNHEQSKVVDMVIECSEQFTKLYMFNHGIEMNGRKMISCWMLCYYILNNYVQSNHRLMEVFRSRTRMVVGKMKKSNVMMEEVCSALESMVSK